MRLSWIISLNAVLFAEYSDNPSLLRIFQAWQQSLALLYATNNGTKRVAPENTLPYLQNDTRLNNQDATANDLLGVADGLPEYRSSFTDEEIAEIRGTDVVTRAANTNQATLDAIEKIAETIDKTSKTVERNEQSMAEIQQKLNLVDEKADVLEQKNSAIEKLIEDAPYKIKGVTEEPVLLVPIKPEEGDASDGKHDFGDFGNFKNQ